MKHAWWKFVGVTMGILLVAAAPARAQNDAPKPPPKPATPLKLTIVLSHYDGDRKVSSVPYTLMVRTGVTATVNMGVQVPVLNSSTKEGVSSFTYKSIGTNMSCTAQPTDDGRFDVRLVVEESGVLPDKPGSTGSARDVGAAGAPAFEDFIVNTNLLLRDGQSVQYASGTNPWTGQVTRMDVTLDIVK